MIKALFFVGVVFLLSPGLAKAESFAERCPDIQTCAKVVGELLGQKYVFDSDVKGKMTATPNLELTKDNAELLFTNMLYILGFSRVPLGVPNSYQILRQRDARDAALVSYGATQKDAPEMPNNWDLATLKYKAANPEIVEEISRKMRNFMPPTTRIIPDENSGMILVTDAIPNLKKMYDLIKDIDTKPNPELKQKWADEKKARQKAELVRKAKAQ